MERSIKYNNIMGKVMLKRITAFSLLWVYLALLVLPYYPYIYYYVYSSLSTKNETSIGIDNQHSLIGDACYLTAITKRAFDKKAKSDIPPPIPLETSGLVYLNSMTHSLLKQPPSHTFNFKRYMVSIKETFLEHPVPPPKYI